MNITRRLFIGLLTAISSLNDKLFATTSADIKHDVVQNNYERADELEVESSSRRFMTSSRTLHGPARMYNFRMSDGGGIFRLQRMPMGTVLSQWECDHRSGLNWLACPGGEIIVRDGESVTITREIIPNCDPGRKDWEVVFFYERPDETGIFPEISFTPQDYDYDYDYDDE